MIDWRRTSVKFNVTFVDISNRYKVVVQCEICKQYRDATYKKIRHVIKKYGNTLCRSCRAKDLWSRQEYRDNAIQGMLSNWADPQFKLKIATSSAKSKSSKRLWRQPQFRSKVIAKSAAAHRILEYRTRASKVTSNWWTKSEYRTRVSDGVKKAFQNPIIKQRAIEGLKRAWKRNDVRTGYTNARSRMPLVSTLQLTFYSILRDLGIRHYREYSKNDPNLPPNVKEIIARGRLRGYTDPECVFGKWSYDCVIPRSGQKSLVIEIQGYFHESKEARTRDKAKSTYLNKYHSKTHELKVLWAHEFSCKDKIIELVKYWMGITKLELIDFNLKDVEIRKCPASDYRELFGKYHYSQSAGRGGITYGAYLGNRNTLIGVCSFSPLVRQNLEDSIGYSKNEIRDLSRLCIHPRYQKKNFASWFITKCIKKLPKKYKTIIAYSDTTFNHLGTVYKASGFKFDINVPPDYWYVDEDGWVMKKKTLYRNAIRDGLTESEYAEKYNYKKIRSKNKLRFNYRRS